MKNVIVVLFLVGVMLLAGCAEVQYGGAKMGWLGDNNTQNLYAEHFEGAMRITVDANTGLHNYELSDANSTYTRFSCGSLVSEGRLPALKDLSAIVIEAVRVAMTPVPK